MQDNQPSDSKSKCGGHLDADPHHPTEECAQSGTPCCECGGLDHCCHTHGRPLNPYEAKQEARRARYEELAEKARCERDGSFERARRIGDVIPLGQPILLGHHSEGRHRRDIKRITDSMRKGVEADKRAKHYDGKADGVGRGGISSDDPDAIAKLEKELAEVEARQAWMKRVNAAHARFLKDPASLEGEDFTEAVKQRIREYKPEYSWEPHPFAPYQLTNNGANARRIRERIKQLRKRDATPARPERMVGDVRVVEDVEANRLQLFFPGKPSEEVRAKLKRHGFKWAPTTGAWQRQRSANARWAAGLVLGVDVLHDEPTPPAPEGS